MTAGGDDEISRGGSRLVGLAGGAGAVTDAFSCRRASRFTSEACVATCTNRTWLFQVGMESKAMPCANVLKHLLINTE